MTDPLTDRPLDVFVHIPKTAGSTLNSVLLRHHAARAAPRLWPVVRRAVPAAVIDNSVGGRWLSRGLARGCSHIELHGGSPVFDDILRRADWVSGHVTRAAMADHMARIGRPARYFTLVRDPAAQIASHYQWWIEIHARGPWRYYRYNRYFRELSRQIRASDNSDPAAVIAVLSEHRELFLNMQTTYAVAPHGTVTPACLAPFEGVAIDNDIARIFGAMTGAAMPAVARLNTSRSTFDRAVFKTPALLAFLSENNARDAALYALAGGVTPPPSP